MKNLTLRNITRACQGTYHGDESLLDREVAGVTIDSRKVEKDFLFVAINGERLMHTNSSRIPSRKAHSALYPTKIWVIPIILTYW